MLNIRQRLWVKWFSRFHLRKMIDKAHDELHEEHQEYLVNHEDQPDFPEWCGIYLESHEIEVTDV